MKILFSVLGYKPAWRIGGPIVSVSSLAETLVELGHEVTVFTTNSNLDEDLDIPTDRLIDVQGVQVRYFRRQEPFKKYLPRFKYLSQSIGALYTPDMPAALELIAGQVDLMHTHMPFVYPTYATARAAFRFRVPLFYHQRGVFDPERLKFRSLKKRLALTLIEKPILTRATTLIGLTEAERQSYALLGVTTPCRVIPNGIHLPEPHDPIADALVLQPFGILPQHKVVLFMGRIHPIKGADKLLEAFIRIASREPNARLVLAGPNEFGLEASFISHVNSSGLSERVIFPGMVSGVLKTTLLNRANLFVLPSSAEGFSMAILEALAHKTAVLISPRCFFPEVEKVGAGRIIEPTVSNLESTMSALLTNPARLTTMGLAGYELVSKQYSWRSIASQMVDAYLEGIARFRTRYR